MILTHNPPDPDSISSAAALQLLGKVLADARTTIAYGGIIGRSENASMVRFLKLKLRPVQEIRFSEYDAIAMVDTQPKTGNNALPSRAKLGLVIDHHPMIAPSKKVPFVDIRTGYGATASILTQYLTNLDIRIDQSLATALLYAIKSETQDLARQAYPIDVDCYVKLFPLANKGLLAKIVRARVSRDYFSFMSKAISNASLVGSAVVTRLGEVSNPDIVPEVADLMLRLEGATWAFASGIYREALYLSIRTTNARKNAGKIMKALVKNRGTGGGHALIAGGRIDVPGESPWDNHALAESVESDFLRRVQKNPPSRVPLVDERTP